MPSRRTSGGTEGRSTRTNVGCRDDRLGADPPRGSSGRRDHARRGAAAAPAEPGSLDPAFSHDGKTYADFGRGNPTESADAVAVQANGKVVAVGTLLIDQATQWDITLWAVARWRADGTLDSSFGGDGRVTTPIGSNDVADSAHAVALHDHGKVLVGGSSDGRFVLIAYTARGALDTSWGEDGIVTTEIPAGVGAVRAVRVLDDGSVIAAGNAGDRLVVVHYRADGSLDPAYGVGGIVTSAQPFGGDFFGLWLRPGGGVVATGYADLEASRRVGVRTVVIDAAGLPDPAFGTGGAVTTQIGSAGASIGRAVAVRRDGRIVVAGSTLTRSGHPRYLLLRYAADGSLDRRFGDGDGYLTLRLRGDAEAEAVALQRDGRIVTVGWAAGSPGRRVLVARATAVGRPDRSFHGTGHRLVGFGAGTSAEGHGVALADGRVYAAGGAQHLTGPQNATFVAVGLRR